MSLSPGELAADVIVEEGEESWVDDMCAGLNAGAGEMPANVDDGCEEYAVDVDVDLAGDDVDGLITATDVLRSPGATSRIPVWVRPKDADRDSGVDEGKDADQSVSPQKCRSPSKRAQGAASQEKQKKVPMNKVQVGTAASPNIKNVKSRIGSLANTSYKPGGGNIKIESHKVDVSKASTKIQAKSSYKPQGGNKKIETRKLDWKAEPKIGSMNNSSYKPGGGNIKVVTQKVDIKAEAKVGSRDNIQHKPGGGDVKVETVKINLAEVASRINSLDNVNHKPQGGDKKIFNDKEFLRQISTNSGSGEGRGRRRSQSDSIDGATELVRN